METLSLTGFKTRSIISLCIIVIVMLLTFGIQQHQLQKQRQNVVFATFASKLSEHTHSVALQLQIYKTPKSKQQQDSLKLQIIADLSLLNESLNYLENEQALPADSKKIISGTSGISALSLEFIEFSRQETSNAAEYARPLKFNTDSLRDLLSKQEKLKSIFAQQIERQHDFQVGILKQLFFYHLASSLSVSYL